VVHGYNVGDTWAIAGQKLKSKYLVVSNQFSILVIGHYSLRGDSNKIARLLTNAAGREEHNAHAFRKTQLN
jgi:hypothetical protein